MFHPTQVRGISAALSVPTSLPALSQIQDPYPVPPTWIHPSSNYSLALKGWNRPRVSFFLRYGFLQELMTINVVFRFR